MKIIIKSAELAHEVVKVNIYDQTFVQLRRLRSACASA